MNPLIDDTRAHICSSLNFLSSSPYAKVICFSIENDVHSYDERYGVIRTPIWENWSHSHGKTLNKTLFGDIFILADFKPKSIDDLQRTEGTWSLVVSSEILEDGESMCTFKVIVPKNFEFGKFERKSLFMILLTNLIPKQRIWKTLKMETESKLIKEILCADSEVRNDLTSVNSSFQIVFI